MTAERADGATALSGQVVPASAAAVAVAGDYSQADQLNALGKAWLAAVAGDSPNTKTAYRNDLRQWFGWCEARGVNPLAARRVHVDLFAEWMREEQGWKKATWGRKLSAVTSFYGYCTDERILDANPAAGVKRPKVGQAVPSTLGLNRKQARALVEAAHADGPRSYALVVVLLTMGLRISEGLNIDIGDLTEDLRGHHTAMITGKGGHTETVVVPPAAWDALTAYIRGRGDGPVFATSTAARWHRTHAFRTLRRLAKKAGIPERTMHPHVLRHTAVTGLREAGHDLRTVQHFARHANITTTQIYDHALRSLDDSLAYAAADWFLGDGGTAQRRAVEPSQRHDGTA